MVGEPALCGTLARKGPNLGRTCGELSQCFVLASTHLGFLEAHLELADETDTAFRALAEQLAPHLGILQLEQRIACFEIRVDRLHPSRFGLRFGKQ